MEPAPCTEVIAVAEPHDWPLEQSAEGTLRPWYLTATGYLMVLFSHPEQAQRARSGLLDHKVPQEDIRLYESEAKTAWPTSSRMPTHTISSPVALRLPLVDVAAANAVSTVGSPRHNLLGGRPEFASTAPLDHGRHPARLTGVVSARSQRQHSLRGVRRR